ncbi:MAG: hypothetical protein ABFS42_04005 [Candidatus Krumholzibacteriota bacterium]
MKTACALLLLMILASAAAAQPVDPDPDGIGIYFHEGAIDESWCADAVVGTQVTAYLCLTRATDTSGFTAWEGRIETSVPGTLVGFTIRGDGTNTAAAPEFVVSYGTPLPYQLSTVLLDITVDVVWEWSIAMRVWPASTPSGPEELPAYTTTALAGTYRTLGYSNGWDPVTKVPKWCASINDDNCLDGPSVPVRDVNWGGVKALYR